MIWSEIFKMDNGSLATVAMNEAEAMTTFGGIEVDFFPLRNLSDREFNRADKITDMCLLFGRSVWVCRH